MSIDYGKLDNEELLHLAVQAMGASRDEDAMVLLKTLLDRDSRHVHGQYLQAALHAQMGLLDRAEAGFRAVVEQAPELVMARFQLGQLLLTRGKGAEAALLLDALVERGGALGAYARAMGAAVVEDLDSATRELEAGLQMPQEVPALAADMQRLLERLREIAAGPQGGKPAAAPGASLFLTGYGRGS